MIHAATFRRALAAAALFGVACAPAAHAQTGPERGVPGSAQRVLSPRDTAVFELGSGRRIYVDYGRPSMRGRRIMGGLVPYGRVWRTGANAATTFVTDVDVDLGTTRVPRGTYTLYSIPSPDGWTLIVNRQTGQWGTQYQPARDFARIPMRVETLRAPVEQFTIALERGRAGTDTLALAWETTRAWVPMRVVRAPAPRRP